VIDTQDEGDPACAEGLRPFRRLRDAAVELDECVGRSAQVAFRRPTGECADQSVGVGKIRRIERMLGPRVGIGGYLVRSRKRLCRPPEGMRRNGRPGYFGAQVLRAGLGTSAR
jgi:hypothetical protein